MKIFLIYLVFFLAVCFRADAKKISEISVEGNKTVTVSRIRKIISLKTGDEYAPGKTGDDISSIYDMGSFDDVAVLTEDISDRTVKVIYRVREKPKIDKIEFKGNEEIKSSKLLRKTSLKTNDFFDDIKMSRDAITLRDYYMKEGFTQCKVEAYTTKDEEKNTIAVLFHINEGYRIKIGRINLTGVVHEKYSKVKKQLKSKKGKTFKKSLLDEDLINIKNYYRNRGYFSVKTGEPVITYSPDHKTAHIEIPVNEGKKHFIRNIIFKGNARIPEECLRPLIETDKGDTFSEDKLSGDLHSIQEFYGTEGYIRVSITPHYSVKESGKVDVEFEIMEGNRVFVRNIYLDGNHITRDYVVRREIKLKQGEPFNLKKVRKSQAEIFKLGHFSNVDVELLPADSPDKTDIVFIVEEQKTGMASIGAGYSSQDKLMGTLRVSQSNFFGRSQQLSASWEFGARKQNYSLSFAEPYLFNTPTPLSLSLYNTDRINYYDNFKYSELRRGGSISIGRHITDELSVYLKYALEQVRIRKVPDAIKDKISEDDDTTSSITPMLVYDTRDYPFDPSTGYRLKVSNQIAGGIFGGKRDFVKLELNGTYFQPLFWKFTGVLNLDIGFASPYSESREVPIYERFYVGGADSIRGYEPWGEIGPSEGGNYKFVANAEIKFPIVSDKGMSLLQGAVFYDIGAAWKNSSDIRFKSGPGLFDLKRGFGFGIRLKTRALPIRIDWGYPLDGSRRGPQWYISISDIF